MTTEAQHGIPVTRWAAMVYGEYAPSPYALRRWIQKGRIQPPPRWIRGRWHVVPTAIYHEKAPGEEA